jgi:hypothetical protein
VFLFSVEAGFGGRRMELVAKLCKLEGGFRCKVSIGG